MGPGCIKNVESAKQLRNQNVPYPGISLNPTFGFKVHKALGSSLESLKDRVDLDFFKNQGVKAIK